LKELKRILGMINYLSKFLPNLSNETKLFRDLEKKDIEWQWTSSHEKQFKHLK